MNDQNSNQDVEARRSRVLTTHSTVLYFDVSAGQLRHGPIASCPANAYLISDGSHGRIMYATGDCLHPLALLDDNQLAPHVESDNQHEVSSSVDLEVVDVDLGLVGFKMAGRFLSAELDGRVTLSRSRCSWWEQFCLRDCQIEEIEHRSTSQSGIASGDNAVAIGTYREFPPFYILAQGYSPFQGGNIALHLLCHHLNRGGFEAYLAVDDLFAGQKFQTSGELHTPVLTAEIARAHRVAHRGSVAIYGEGYLSNRLICDRVVRYLLYRPGARALERGDAATGAAVKQFWRDSARKTEFVWHFAEEFQIEGVASRPLFIPIVNERIFRPPTGKVNIREGFLVYSHRVKVQEQMIPTWARPFTMIEMSNPRGPEELARLYRKSRALIVFERTGAQLEALMCGCPVVGIPNKHFHDLPMFGSFGNVGVGWGNEPAQLQWAETTVEVFQRIYRAYSKAFPDELKSRIEEALEFFG